MNERDFKGVWIPKEIWLHKELSAIDRIIYAEIDSLDNETHCTASNEYLAEFCGVSVSTITRSIQKLIDLGFIEVESFDGRHRVIKMTKQPSQIDEADSSFCVSNNIYNNIDNNINNTKVLFNNSQRTKTSISKTKKKNLYEKCTDSIDEYTNNPKLRGALYSYRDMILEKCSAEKIPMYANVFKGKLNELSRLSDDTETKIEIVQQSVARGWMNFYEVKSTSRRDPMNESGVVRSIRATEFEEGIPF